MTTHPKKTLPLILVAAFSLSFLPTNSDAQSRFFDQNPFSFMGFGHPQRNDDLGQKVYMIDSLADQMAWRFGWEIRYRRGCNDSIALLQLMRNHTRLTDGLIKAYRGDCGKTFAKAACDVRDNLTRIQNLRKRVQVSESVCALITRSCPLTTYVHKNSHRFRPVRIAVPQRPSCGTPAPATRPQGGRNPYDNGYHNTGYNRGGGSFY